MAFKRILIALALSISLTTRYVDAKAVQNSNHILNAIHNAMRQFWSSLDHNGMSAFIATVPVGTQLYHGTNKADRVNGTEWLAFESEHALVFAHSRQEPPGRGPPEVRRDAGSQQAFPGRGEREAGRPMSDRMNMSAAKSAKGTLDMQDLVLLHENPPIFEEPRSRDYQPRADETAAPHEGKTGGPMGEADRAVKLCALAREEWSGRIDGFLRMELGFEIILCDFAGDLDVDRITQLNNASPSRDGGDQFSYYQAVASRFDGIGGKRVWLNYDNFVTLFDEGEAVYFDESGLPRVRNETRFIRPVVDSITKLAMREPSTESTDWQAITDMVVSRYADRIAYLASGNIVNLQFFRAEVDRVLRPYIDYGDRNASAEIA